MKKNKILLINLILILVLTSCGVSNKKDSINYEEIVNNNEETLIEKESEDVLNESISNENVEIYFFDVGQADCTLFIDNGKTLLVDTGDIHTSDKVLNYLDKLNVSKIDYLILTHPHADHIGGAPDIINKYEIDEILMPNKTTTSKVFGRTISAIEDHKYEINIPLKEERYELGSGYFTTLVDSSIDHGDDINDSSISVKVSFGEVDIVLTGDASINIEKEIINSNLDIDAEILKIGHHGSRTATSEEFLEKVSPEYAIISCGLDNSYGHPHIETLKKLENIKYYRTDKDGTIKFTINNTIKDIECINNF